MSKIFSTIFYTFLITVVSTSPVPAIPLVMLNYKVNGLFLGYIATLIGGLIASINQFFLSRNLVRNLFKRRFPKKYIFIDKYSKIISKMNNFEFILLLLSGTIPNSIISLSSGLANMPFKKFIGCLVLVSIPQQLIFVAAAAQLDNFEKIFLIKGFDKLNSIIFTITICSLIVFLISYGLRMINLIIKFKKNNNKK